MSRERVDPMSMSGRAGSIVGRLTSTCLAAAAAAWRDVAGSAWFAYFSIGLLQLHRVWGAWKYKDLTYGDTSSYFVSALGWVRQGTVNILWSPLYTAYYGSIFDATGSVYAATLLHRLVIVFALTLLVLAIARRLLPPEVAWLVAAWWAILPINFDSLYEVHLFALLIPLGAVLVVLARPSVWGRGVALGMLLLDMTLVRNEVSVVVLLWGALCLVWEIREIRRNRRHPVMVYLGAYGLPAVLALLVFLLFWQRSIVKPTAADVSFKGAFSFCQAYAYGFQQRHPEWTENPMTQCQDLTLEVFGEAFPSMSQAARANLRGFLGHVWWNIRLLPAGFQLGLFDATSSPVNPDYVPATLGKPLVLVPSFLLLVVYAVGLRQLVRRSRFWWISWIRPRVWGWLLMLCLATVLVVVIPIQRPRPSYMFLAAFLLMAASGMCLFAALEQTGLYKRGVKILPAAMIALVLLVPSAYQAGPRPLLAMYNRLSPAAAYVGIPQTAIVTDGYGQELCNYFAQDSRSRCVGYDYSVFGTRRVGETVGELLDSQAVPVVAFYVDQTFEGVFGSDPIVQHFLSAPDIEGWKLVSLQDAPGETWRLYVNARRLGLASP